MYQSGCSRNQGCSVEVLERAEHGVHGLVVRDVVAEVVHRRRIDRRQPEGVHAEPREVIKPLLDPAEVAHAITVGVLERARVDLVDDRVLPPHERVRLVGGALRAAPPGEPTRRTSSTEGIDCPGQGSIAPLRQDGRVIRARGEPQPLTAPAVIPATIRFWKMITASTSGMVITTDAALMVPSGISNFWLPVKFATDTGTVKALGELVSVTASRNSFHTKKAVSRPAVTRPGAASGSTTFRNAWK